MFEMRQLLVLVALLLPACGTSRAYFIPREDVRAQSPRGWPAAQYAVANANEASVGEVRIWSEGAQRLEIEGEKRSVLHIGFEIENRSTAPMVLEVPACRLAEVEVADVRLASVAPDGDQSNFEVPAGRSGLIDLEFVMPRDTLPRDIEEFKAQWTLTAGAIKLVQSTPFRVDTGRTRGRAYGYYGYYGGWGPYYDPWWGFGTGFAVGTIGARGFWGPRWGRWCW